MQREINSQQPDHLSGNDEQRESTSRLEWVQPVLQKAPIAETANEKDTCGDGVAPVGGNEECS
jgi:hypothetical protein